MKRVLIAHQSTIPHYRVSFYNAVERLRPDSWRFDVVFDSSELKTKRFFKEPLDVDEFDFPILEASTVPIKLFNKQVAYQTFWLKAASYDLIVVGSALDNLTYPLCQLHRLRGARFAYWGHGTNRSVENPSPSRILMEKLRDALSCSADGFFAYTEGVKRYLESRGLSAEKIFVLNNTIDISRQRTFFAKWRVQREQVRQRLGVQGKKVLLFVGRFTENKRIDFLLEAFRIIKERDSDFRLLLVGSGGEPYLEGHPCSALSYLGPIVDLGELAPIYVASDLFVFPGAVGLGPLQALCYDLPVVAIDSLTHMPEFEYLLPTSSVVLESSTTPEEYAQTVLDLFDDAAEEISSLKAHTWLSIKHLTIENMAQSFIDGVNAILGL